MVIEASSTARISEASLRRIQLRTRRKTRQAAALMRGLAGINIQGGDVVEVSPPFDTTGATAIAGAHVAVEICQLLGWRMRGGA